MAFYDGCFWDATAKVPTTGLGRMRNDRTGSHPEWLLGVDFRWSALRPHYMETDMVRPAHDPQRTRAVDGVAALMLFSERADAACRSHPSGVR